MLRSIDTSSSGASAASGPCPDPELAVDDPFVRLEVIAIGDDVLAGERAAAADVLIAVEVHVAAANAGDPRAQHRNQSRTACARRSRNAAHGRDLILLDVDQEHVRRRRVAPPARSAQGGWTAARGRRARRSCRGRRPAGSRASGCPAGEVRSRHAAAGTMARGQAGARRAPGPRPPDAAPARQPRTRSRRWRPPASDAACQAATPTSAAVTASVAVDLRPVDRSPSAGDRAAGRRGDGSGRARKRVEPPDQEERLDASHLEKRHEREQQRNEQPDAQAPAAPPTPSARTRCRRSLPSETPESRPGRPQRGRRRAGCQPGRGAPPAARRSPAPAGSSRRGTSGSRRCGSSAGRTRASRSRRRCRRGRRSRSRPGSDSSRRARGPRRSDPRSLGTTAR